MATNNNGNLLDSAGEVAIDFVWGNMPMQPNDARPDTATGRLDPELDNHIIALSGWGGYPQFVANSAGEDVVGDAVDYVLVPSVLGLTTALATDAMKDASLVPTTATAATNTATQPTRVNVTATDTATITITGGNTSWPVGTKVTIASGTGIPTAVVGTWTVTGGSGSTLVITGSGWTVADSGAITPGTVLTGTAGTIRTQSLAAAQNNVAPGAAVTITPWASAS